MARSPSSPRSSSRKVARAAATGGGRTSRGKAPILWYGALSVIVVLGLTSVAVSRYQRQHPTSVNATAPTTHDHWRVAFAFDLCGTVQSNVPPAAGQTGITTKGDGVIYVNPTGPADSGHNATLGRFITTYRGMSLSATGVTYPGRAPLTNGDRCNGRPATVQVKVWTNALDQTGHVVSGNPGSLLLEDGQLVTIAFVPAGAVIPQPPSKPVLSTPVTTTTSTPTPTPAPATHTTQAPPATSRP